MNADSEHDSVIGQVLASRYQIEALIGEGAMGAVYRARHVKVGRTFAVKVLHPRFAAEERTRKRFAREAEVAGTLHHANVVSVVDVGELPDGRRYLVMEYAEGITLLDLINEAAPMAPARMIPLVRQLCAGLQHAHELGLIHRDFKPDNVIVERDRHGNDTPRIVDFGTAILRDEAAEPSAERLTTRGLVLGTPHYMSPEHATADPIDHRIDLFALGVTCFEMMTGHSPYEGDGVDVARANLLLDTPVMSVRVPGLVVDPLLEAFTRKLMMKSRDDRPASAAAARDLIDLIERDRPAAAAALGVVLDEPRPVLANIQATTQPIPFEIDIGTQPIPTAVAMPWPTAAAASQGAPAAPNAMTSPAFDPGGAAGAAMTPGWAPPPGAMPGGQPPWPVPPPQPWQPAVRSPSSPPYGDAMRARPHPEATEQIQQMHARWRPVRVIIPAVAAIAVLAVMFVALRGRHHDESQAGKRIKFSELGSGAGEALPPAAMPVAPVAMPVVPVAPAPAPVALPVPAPAAAVAAVPAPASAPADSTAAAAEMAAAMTDPGTGTGSAVVAARVAPEAKRSTAVAARPSRPAALAASDGGKPAPILGAPPAAGDKPDPAHPAPPPANHPITMPVTAAGVAELYASVGRQLKALDETHGSAATASLWPLYLRIHINDVISDSSKLADASSLLYRIEDQVARRSAQR